MKTGLIIGFLCLVLSLSISCTDEKNTYCNAGTFTKTLKNDQLAQTPFEILNPVLLDNIIYYSYPSQGEIRFTMGKNLFNVCPEKLITFRYNAITTNFEQTKPFRIIVEAEWNTPNSSAANVIIHHPDPLLPGQLYESVFDIDVSEDYIEQPATIGITISIEFLSSNSFEEDRTYLVDHIESFELEANGDLFK